MISTILMRDQVSTMCRARRLALQCGWLLLRGLYPPGEVVRREYEKWVADGEPPL